MNFKNWLLENKSTINFISWLSDGTITVLIDNHKYRYNTDAHLHNYLRREAKYKPWTALNIIKKLVSDGRASMKKIA